MGIIVKSLIVLQGSCLKHSFDADARKPLKSQTRFLLKTLDANKDTEYGCEYNFKQISNVKEFQKNIPVNSYQDIEPYINKIVNGKKDILTADEPILFNLTSGTSDKPKYILVTANTQKRTALLLRQWLYRAFLDHAHYLDANYLFITSAAIEGDTPSGIPYGSLSGLIYKNMPRVLKQSYLLPYAVADIKNYDLRYYVMARLSLEKDVSFIATPNPSTLIKIAKVCMKYQDEIVQSINDGCLYSSLDFTLNDNDQNIVDSISAALKPNKSRARFCSAIIKKYKSLTPFHCWPSLSLIGCWLGGSVGYHAEKLSKYYGDVPKRDIGYLATEGCFTLPYKDNTSAGILALQNNFYEFIHEEDINAVTAPVLLSHELEIGKQYKILITNESGLCRYDINDTIRVEDFYYNTPVISFVRKTSDVLNITGEKLHLNQILLSLRRISDEFNIKINHFRVVSNQKELRYDIFIQLGTQVSKDVLKHRIIPAIDSNLCDSNIEYAQKRKSKRLNPPCLHIMDAKWEENMKKSFVLSGKRDIQYKWQIISSEFLEIDREYVKETIIYKE